tara:strand:+ start:126 stop:551 length:426 start_codon:yes stop_codon:yes gene_type:complete
MGKTQQQFLAQRELELMAMSSRDLKAEAQQQADQMLQESNAEEIYSKSVRLEKYLAEFNKSIKSHIENMDTINGVEFQEGQRVTFNFADDPEYRELETLLKGRKDLLQARVKLMKTIFDDQGEEVPLVTSKTTTFIKAIIK